MKRLCIVAATIILAVAATQTKAYTRGYPQAGVSAHMSVTLKNALQEQPTEVTEADIDLLARLITAEVGTDNEERAYLCGSVVINRMRSDDFPDTLEEVIYQTNPIQYECIENGHINNPYTDIAWEIAEELLTEGTTVDGIIYQAEFQQGKIYKQIGNTYFCYGKDK
jgi:spore germination cell wall hydrolase CwlJ-like protein